MQTGNKYLRLLTYFLVFALFAFLTSNKHSHSREGWGYINYQGVVFADMAGYYVYLPATFNYQYNPHLFPDTMDARTGNGFGLHMETNKVFTKYTYGVALLEMPFYLIAQTIAPALGYPADGFSAPYHWALDISAAFYLTVALAFLFSILSTLYSRKAARLTLFTIVLATNLYYYTVDDGSMSHVYSFFLFSAFLYLLHKTDYLRIAHYKHYILLGLVAGLIILVRPTSVLFLTCFFFINVTNKAELIARWKSLFKKQTIVACMVAVLVFIPQLLYWKYLHGQYIYFSYGNEGFFWLRPLMHLTWFSPNNGLFLYNPIYVFIVIAAIVYAKNYGKMGSYYILLFLLISYVFSCWWAWAFGCAYGARSFVEYLAIFSIPIAFLYQKILKFKLIKQVAIYLIILVLVGYNLKMIYSYDGCYLGKWSAEWDWTAYMEHLKRPTK